MDNFRQLYLIFKTLQNLDRNFESLPQSLVFIAAQCRRSNILNYAFCQIKKSKVTNIQRLYNLNLW